MLPSLSLSAPKGTCTAITKKGKPCEQPEIAPGFGLCHAHVRYNPINLPKRSRYLANLHAELQSKFKYQSQDANPKDLQEEIVLLRTYLDQMHHQLANQDKIDSDTLVACMNIVELLGRTIERHAKINPERMIPVPVVMTMVSKIIDILNETIPRENVDLRQSVVNAINKYVVTELMAESTVYRLPGSTDTDNGHEAESIEQTSDDQQVNS
jgi:hypothetical protein